MKWTRGRNTIEMRDEPTYSFGSRDNVRAYERELLLVSGSSVTSRHGLVSFDGAARVSSLVIGTGAGATGVHERSALLVHDRCFVAVGPELVCVSVPALEVLWHREADPATCFGLHLSPTQQAVVVHGELEISSWTLNGQRMWSFGGSDIFTGPLSIVGEAIVVADFGDRVYQIDLESGQE